MQHQQREPITSGLTGDGIPGQAWTDLVQRVARVAQLNGAPGTWNRQRRYGGPFTYERRDLQTADIIAALQHRCWLGSRAPVDGDGTSVTDRIALDLDCKAADGLPMRDARYRAIRRLFGAARVPLVYQTPSGWGLRVVYRIGRVPLAAVITGPRTGLVADVLRGAGLPVDQGEIEIFPQVGQADRLMLGRGMPVLDPETLRPMGDSPIGDTFCEAALRWALHHVEAWYDRPCEGLLADLARLPGVPHVAIGTGDRLGASDHDLADDGTALLFVRRRSGLEVTATLDRLVRRGLDAPGTRYRSEFLAGVALALAPLAYPEFGLCRHPTHRELAEAIASWLSMRHNGCSTEWTRSCRRRTPEAAVAWWARRYLQRNRTTGDHMIERIARVAGILDPGSRRVLQLTDAERWRLHAIAERQYPAGARRYRFEVWACRWLRAIKEVISYHEDAGRQLSTIRRQSGTVVFLQLSAAWMQAWPYGKGDGAERTSYVEYVKVLEREGLMRWAAPYVSPTLRAPGDPEAVQGRATTYRVIMPESGVELRELGVSPWELQQALVSEAGPYGRPWTLDEAYHALWAVRAGVRLSHQYGRKTQALIVRLAALANRKADPQAADSQQGLPSWRASGRRTSRRLAG